MSKSATRPKLDIPEMDAQHAYLYSLFDRIDEEMSREDMASLLEEIEGYLDFHMSSEEHLIRLYKVPGFEVHQTDHHQAAEAFIKHTRGFDDGSFNPARLRNAMTGWLAEHSASADMEYAEKIKAYRKENGYIA